MNRAKSTFIKQMRIIHGRGYSDEDRLHFKTLVYRNLYTAIHALVDAMELLQIPYEEDENSERAAILRQTKPENVEDLLDQEHQDAFRHIWADPGIQKCYDRRREFQLSDSTK